MGGGSKLFKTIQKECLERGELYEDPDFEPDFTIVDPNMDEDLREFLVWKRPREIRRDAKLFVQGADRQDVKQGVLGNCWFLASLASLTTNHYYFNRVAPPDQEFTRSDYVGALRFNFWQYGEWKEVIIDDRLPTYNGHLLFTSSPTVNEFWPALLEKAYAKLFGSFVLLKGGQISEALVDFTSGIGEDIDLTRAPSNLLQIVYKAIRNDSLLGCSIKPVESGVTESILECGLVAGHAYSITSIENVQQVLPPELVSSTKTNVRKLPDGDYLTEEPVLRVRNPWGSEVEWNGNWSDNSDEWSYVSEEEKRRTGFTMAADGEFWISFADFMNNFHNLTICHNTKTDGDHVFTLKAWEGSWSRGVTDGGCRNHLESFERNNQFRVLLKDSDLDGDGKCTIICSLMQKGYRENKDKLTIGFSAYRIEDEGLECPKLTKEYFKFHRSVSSPVYMNSREVVLRADLEPGEYCIIPTTYKPGYEGDYYMRLLVEANVDAEEMKGRVESKIMDILDFDESSDNKEMESHILHLLSNISHCNEELDPREALAVLKKVYSPHLAPDLDCCRALVHTCTKSDTQATMLSVWRFYDHTSRIIDQVSGKDGEGMVDAAHMPEIMNKIGLSISNSLLKTALIPFLDPEGFVHCSDVALIAARIHCLSDLCDELHLVRDQQRKVMETFFKL